MQFSTYVDWDFFSFINKQKKQKKKTNLCTEEETVENMKIIYGKKFNTTYFNV